MNLSLPTLPAAASAATSGDGTAVPPADLAALFAAVAGEAPPSPAGATPGTAAPTPGGAFVEFMPAPTIETPVAAVAVAVATADPAPVSIRALASRTAAVDATANAPVTVEAAATTAPANPSVRTPAPSLRRRPADAPSAPATRNPVRPRASDTATSDAPIALQTICAPVVPVPPTDEPTPATATDAEMELGANACVAPGIDAPPPVAVPQVVANAAAQANPPAPGFPSVAPWAATPPTTPTHAARTPRANAALEPNQPSTAVATPAIAPLSPPAKPATSTAVPLNPARQVEPTTNAIAEPVRFFLTDAETAGTPLSPAVPTPAPLTVTVHSARRSEPPANAAIEQNPADNPAPVLPILAWQVRQRVQPAATIPATPPSATEPEAAPTAAPLPDAAPTLPAIDRRPDPVMPRGEIQSAFAPFAPQMPAPATPPAPAAPVSPAPAPAEFSPAAITEDTAPVPAGLVAADSPSAPKTTADGTEVDVTTAAMLFRRAPANDRAAIPSTAAKPAAPRAVDSAIPTGDDAYGEKNVLTSSPEKGRGTDESVGIGVADSVLAMPVEYFTRPTRTWREHVPALVERVVSVDLSLSRPTPEAAPADPATTAHQAVATVLNLVETHEARRQAGTHTVTLQFRVGGDDLAVRVELRDGAVHTQFRTDSTELRLALAREWQAVSTQMPDRPLRLTEPTFAPSANAHDDTPFSRSDDDASQHQARLREEFLLAAGAPRRSPAVPAASSTSSVRGPVAPPTALHLSAFA